MKMLAATYVALEGSMSKIEIKFEHEGVVYEGAVWSENDGRDAEIDHDTFNHPIPQDLEDDFWDAIFETDENTRLYEAALEIGYAEWEQANI